MSDDPNFFRDWMDERRLKAADVCDPLQVSMQTIHQWRSYGVPERRVPHVRKFMDGWKDPSAAEPEARIAELRAESFVMKPTEEQFDAWNRAANAEGQTVREWITATLIDAAKEFEITKEVPEVVPFRYDNPPPPSSMVADGPAWELPFLGAVAAGEPVCAPRVDETLPVPRHYLPGHFVVEVNGGSAEPDYPDGSRWVIDGRDKHTPKNGAVCVVSDGAGSYLKRWNRKRGVFESVNPEFNDILPGEEAKLQGYPVERI